MTPSRKTSAILTALSLLALILLVPVALALSPQGLKLACHWLSRLQPDIQLVYESGHLLEGRLAMMSMNSDALSVNVEGVSWKLARDCLWSSKLCFDVFEVDRALVKLQTDKNSDGSDARATIFPFEIIAENAQINRLIIHQIDGTEFEVSAINFAGQAYEKTVNLTRFSASYSSAQLSAQGQIKLSAELQLALALQLRYTRSEDDYYSANASIEGSLDELEIVGALTHPEKIEVRGWLRPRDLATSLIMSHVGTIPAVGSDWVLQDPTLQINGAWPALDFTFQSDLGSKQLGSSAVTIAARTSESTLEVSSFELSSQYVNWIGQGHIDYTPDLTGRFNTDLSLICPPETGPRLVCALDGTVDITGSLRDSILAISLDGDLQGSINQTMARLTTTLKGTSEGELQLGATELRVAENILRLTGNVGQNSDLIGNLDLVNLGQFLPGVTGSGRGNWRISGPISNPVASADFNLNSLSGKNLGLHELSLTAGWSGLTDRGWIDLASSGGNWGDAVLTHARSRCEFEVANVDAGRVSCVDVYFNIASDAEPWQLSEPLKMSWESVTADATVDPFCLFSMSRSVCSTLPIRFGGDEVDGIKLVGENFDLNWVRRWLPPDIDIDGAIGFELSASRSALNGSRAEFTLASPLLNIGLQTAGKTIIHPVTELESRAAISDNEINMDWRFSVGSAGSSKGHIEINDWPGTRNIEGSAVLSDIDLSPFMMVTDGVLDARSRLSGKVALNGTISAPLLTGRLQLTDGYLDHENLPQPLQAFELDMDFVGPEASLKGGFTVPAGSGDIAGKVSWREDDWLALLQLKATGLELEPLRGSHVTVAPDLSLVLTPRRATISGDIQIPVARIVLDELPRTAVKISQDTVLAGHTDDSNDFDYELNLHVQLGKEISLFARGATSELSGSVDLIREIDQPLQAHGTIEVDSGRYVAYGQKLEVTEGRFYFNGALTRPSVRLEAVRPLEERNVKVGVRVTGDAMRPEIKLFSQPAMDDNLTLHYLLTGAAPTAGTNLDLVVATAMMQLGLAGAGSKLESVMGKYGISDIQLGATNQAEGTELDISAYISPRLFVRYGISTFDRVNTLRARYRLKNDLFIEAISGATSAIDILYAFDL